MFFLCSKSRHTRSHLHFTHKVRGMIMRNHFFSNDKETTLRYLPRYLFIFSCAVILATFPLGISYYATLKNLERNIEHINQKSAQQIRDLCQERLNEINNVIHQAGSHHLTSFILNLDGKWSEAAPEDIMTAKQHQEYLQNLTLPSDMILEITIYSEKSGLLFKYNGSLPFEDWYETSFAGHYITLKDWQNTASGARQGRLLPGCTYYTSGIPLKIIPYVQKLPLGSHKQLSGHISVLIDRDKFLSGLVRSNTFEALWVMDENGVLLTSWGNTDSIPADLLSRSIPHDTEFGSFTKTFNGSPHLVTFARSGTGLNFVTAAPYSKVFKPAQTMKNIFFTMLLVCLFSLTASCLTFARKLSPPLKRLLSDNDALQSQLAGQKAEVRTSIISRLLTGCFGTKEEILSALESVDISCEAYRWCAVVLRIAEDTSLCGNIVHKASDYLLVKARIRTLICQTQNSTGHTLSASNLREEASFPEFFVIDTGIDCLTLVCGVLKSPQGEESSRARLSSLITEIQDFLLPYHIFILAGGGSFYSDMAELHISYEEALFALKSHVPADLTGLLWYRTQTSIPAFFYPAELEQRILISTKCGDLTGLTQALDYIYRENYQNTAISAAAGELLILRLKTALLTAGDECPCPDEDLARKISSFVFREQTGVSVHQTFMQLRDFFLSLCRLSLEAQTEKQKSLKIRLLEFVNGNCFDPNMSLTMAADAFELSENYISAFFKEQTGINFLSYIENRRMQKSCSLLSETGKTIDTIAFIVGYTSSHSFRRAFKRKYGVTPAKYRKENGSNTPNIDK